MGEWVSFPLESDGPGHNWVQSLTDFEPELYLDFDEDPSPRIGRFRVRSFMTTVYSAMDFLRDIHTVNFGSIGRFFFHFLRDVQARDPESLLTPYDFKDFLLKNRTSMDNFDSLLTNWENSFSNEDLHTTAVMWTCTNCGLKSISNTEPNSKSVMKVHVFNVGTGTHFSPMEMTDDSCEFRQFQNVMSI